MKSPIVEHALALMEVSVRDTLQTMASSGTAQLAMENPKVPGDLQTKTVSSA